MEFLSVLHTDVGIKKKTNQDSVLIKEADTDYGKVMLAVICDGMGGLAKGEVASSALIRALSDWFENEFPDFLYNRRTADGISRLELENALNLLVIDVNQRIAEYAKQFHAACGTTAAVLLMAEGRYYIMNIGDSRVYKISTYEFTQITKDQTFVQMEMDHGRMTPEEARVHPQRNVLLQCVGASEVIIPDFSNGTYQAGEIFMICSDGFRHLITEDEFRQLLDPVKTNSEKDLKDAAIYCTELNKSRQERDNISVVLIKVV